MRSNGWRQGASVVTCSALLLGLAGCASRNDDPTSAGAAAPSPAERTNATVRSVTYMEAAPNVEPAPPRAAPVPAGPARGATTAQRRTRAAKSRADATRVAAKPSTPAAAAPARSPASGWRYTYSVELDHGGTRNFGFPADQGLAVLDRVRVDGERLVVPPR